MRSTSGVRSATQVFKHHGKAGEQRDLEAYVSDFSPHAVLITPDAVYSGRSGVRKWVTEFWKKLEGAKFAVNREIHSGSVILVRYKCMAHRYRILDGVATFVVSNGYFTVLTNSYTLIRRVRKSRNSDLRNGPRLLRNR